MPILEREGMNPGESYFIRMSPVGHNYGQFEICVYDRGYTDFPCKIEFVEATGQSVCDPITNTYTQELTIHYRDNDGQATNLYFINEYLSLQASPMVVQIPNVPANSGWQQIDAQLAPITTGSCYSNSYFLASRGFQRSVNCFSGTLPNDDCAGAIDITADNMCIAYTGNNVGATYSGSGGYCVPFTQGTQDVWFKHVTTSTEDIIINAWEGTDVSPNIQVYTETCGFGQLVFVGCVYSNNSVRLTGLGIAQTIYIQAKDSNDDNQGDFNLCLINPVPTTNDICVDAIPIQTGSTCDLTKVFSNHFSTDESNGTNPPICDPFLDGFDLWYSLVVPAEGYVTFSLNPPISGDNEYSFSIVELYEGSCGSLQLLDCSGVSNGSSFEILNRVPGEILYARVISEQSASKPYVICTPELSNNFCVGAVDIPIGTCLTTDNYNSTPSNNPYSGLLCGGNGVGNDVWFSAVVPSSGNITMESIELANGLGSINLEVYEGVDCTSLNPIACSSEKDQNTNYSLHGRIELEGRTPGETLYIRATDGFGGSSEGEFQICIADAGYSNPCQIELIQTIGQSSCDPFTNTYTQDLLISYRHDGSATHIEMFNNSFPVTTSPQLISFVLPAIGTPIDIHANLNSNFSYSDCYQLSRYTAIDAIQAPSPCVSVLNDECVNAIPLQVSNSECVENVYDNIGATYSVEAGFTCYAANESQDIWFSVVVPPSGELIINTYEVDGLVPSAFDIYEGTCNNLTQIEDCGFFTESIRLTGRQPGELLYILAYSADVLQQGEFGICAMEPQAFVNDVCNDAIGIPLRSTCSSQIYSTHFANDEIGAFNCNGSYPNSSNDIWFNVVAPNSGSLNLKTEEVERGSSHIYMEVYLGGCQSVFNTCAHSNSTNGHAEIDLNGLTPGSVLQVRITSRSQNQPATFFFCATSECPNVDVIAVPVQGTEDYEADISIYGNETILNGSNVTFDAGQHVNLDPGFDVISGAIFHAFIDGCGGI